VIVFHILDITYALNITFKRKSNATGKCEDNVYVIGKCEDNINVIGKYKDNVNVSAKYKHM
jgi:hypothetical protein